MDDLLTLTFNYHIYVSQLTIFFLHSPDIYISMVLSLCKYLDLRLLMILRLIGIATAISFLETMTVKHSWINNCTVMNTYSNFIWLCNPCCSLQLCCMFIGICILWWQEFTWHLMATQSFHYSYCLSSLSFFLFVIYWSDRWGFTHHPVLMWIYVTLCEDVLLPSPSVDEFLTH